MSFFRQLFSSKILPSWTILLFDAIVVAVSVLFAYLIRFPIVETMGSGHFPWWSVFVITFANLIFFRLFRTYSNILRLSSFVDVMHVFVALTLAFFCNEAISLLWPIIFGKQLISFSVLFIAYLVSFAVLASSRMMIKMMYDNFKQDKQSMLNTYIYGTTTGIDIAKSLRTEADNRFHIVGFVSDDPTVVGKVMMGVNVYPNDEELPNHFRHDRVAALIVSPAKAKTLKDSDLSDRVLKEGIKIFLAPEVSDDWDSSQRKPVVKEVQIEDLLGRDPIKINLQEIAAHLEGKRVLITGAAGSIGSEIMRQVAKFNPYQLILIDSAETPLHDIRLELKNKWSEIEAPTIVANVTNKPRMESIFAEYRPDYVFHAAAYKHVPMMEDNVSEAIQNNVQGTRILADLAVKYGVRRFVMVSTDKAVNPSNVMGCSKRICEIYVQSLNQKLQKEAHGANYTQFVTTRFGNVLGSNGSVIPLFREQIKRGGPVTVTDERIVRFFMLIPEACKLVLEAGTKGNGGEIFVFDMGQPVKIADLAKRMIALSNAKNVEIKYTGLREGEKLYEEVLNEMEGTKPTFHEKIRIAQVREYDYDEVAKEIDELVDIAKKFDNMDTVRKMKEIVPEYKSNNSVYEVLDKTNREN